MRIVVLVIETWFFIKSLVKDFKYLKLENLIQNGNRLNEKQSLLKHWKTPEEKEINIFLQTKKRQGFHLTSSVLD